MAHPNARLIPIADFDKGTLQAPAFLRAEGAASEMEDLMISLKGRPIPRKGYEVITPNFTIGTTDGEYDNGDSLVVVHWLGDDDVPDGVKRGYRLPRDASWVQDEVGRVMYVASPELIPNFIDLKENVAYEWVMDAPGVTPGATTAFEMTPVGQSAVNANRDLDQIEAGDYETGGINRVFPNPASDGVYIDTRALTDITYARLHVRDLSGTLIRILYEGFLGQGGQRFFWDGRNQAGNVVASSTYVISFTIDEQPGTIVENLDDEERVVLTGASTNPMTFELTAQFRYVCFTYGNEDLNIESLPTGIAKERIYFWAVAGASPVEFRVVTAVDTSSAPDWASQLNIYVSEEPTPPRDETLVAIETGFTFRRLGSLQRFSDGSFANVLSDYTGDLDPESPVLDSYDHDGPVDGFRAVANYGIGLWGAAENRVYFSKIGSQGEQRLYALPLEHAIVPHSFPLPRSGQSPIIHIHPAAHEAALMVFKRDALHLIRGRGVISGLYDPDTPVQVDVDASSVINGVGTMAPRSVLTVGNAVYFVGSDRRFYQFGTDWRGRTDLRDVGLPIQRYLDELSVDDMQNLVAFLYQNCYHLIMPDRMVVMDMTRKYWSSVSWELKDAIWSRGGLESESVLYGLTQSNEIVELFTGDTDNGDPIGGVWQSNPIMIPSESSVTGVLVVHTTTPPPTLRCRIDVDDVEGDAVEFTPAAYNDFRCGFHGHGSRVVVRLESDDGFPLVDRIQAEIFVVR